MVYPLATFILKTQCYLRLFSFLHSQMSEIFGEVAHRMPLQLVEPVEKMINRDIRYRPTAQLFMLVSCLFYTRSSNLDFHPSYRSLGIIFTETLATSEQLAIERQ